MRRDPRRGLARLAEPPGLVLNAVSTMFHPGGAEDNHEVIFAQYADSAPWVAVHIGQFVGVLLTLGGLLVLSHAMRAAGQAPLLPSLASAATIATAAIWAVLQGLDGVGLKQAVEAWQGASGTEEAMRLAGAEIIRWLEWGFQSYFRLLLGVTLLLVGAGILAGRLMTGWLGWTAVLAGVISVVFGVDVGYSGLASPLQDALSMIFLIVVLVFSIGVLATGMRERTRHGTRTCRAIAEARAPRLPLAYAGNRDLCEQMGGRDGGVRVVSKGRLEFGVRERLSECRDGLPYCVIEEC